MNPLGLVFVAFGGFALFVAVTGRPAPRPGTSIPPWLAAALGQRGLRLIVGVVGAVFAAIGVVLTLGYFEG